MARKINTYRVTPSKEFVNEWEDMLLFFRDRDRPHKFLESVYNQYLDSINRDISARQAIAVDKCLADFHNRKRLYKDVLAWEQESYAPIIRNDKEISKEDEENIHWLNSMEEGKL